MSMKRSCEEAQHEESQSSKQQKCEPSTEDLEEAMYQVSKAAAADREKLVEKAKCHFKNRNGREPSESELETVFDTLRESLMDEDAAQSSEDESDDEGVDKLQDDIESAFEHCRDLGKEASKKMQEHLKKVWSQENNGAEPSSDETAAVMYHLKHLAFGAVPVEDEADETDADEEYEPSELEKDAADEDEETPCEKEECNFDFNSHCEVDEEQFEKMVEKFCESRGREPTEAEADAMLESFSSKFVDATYDEHDDVDYQKEEEPESEDDEEGEEDKSLESDCDMEEEESDECEYYAEEQSNAFKYMKEVEEGSDDEGEEEEEPSKQEQAEESAEQMSVCA